MGNLWRLKKEPWWNPSTQSINFELSNGQIRHTCAISQDTLNNYYNTEDTQEAAFSNFDKDRDKIIDIAVKLIHNYEPNGDGIYFIKSNNIQKTVGLA